MFAVELRFSPGLHPLLYPRDRRQPGQRTLFAKTSVKDLIESCGAPHTEVDLILIDNEPADLARSIDRSATVQVYGVGETPEGFVEHRLQPASCDRFVADGHLGKLVRWLRLLGLDVAYAPQIEDRELLRVMERDHRGLLTRDRRLLMHRIVETGYCPRSDNAEEQAVEVLRRFHLSRHHLAPFSRCLRCNGRLETVSKSEVEPRLEPLTKRYYTTFQRCRECDRIYWSGSHSEKLRRLVERLTKKTILIVARYSATVNCA